MVSLSVGAGLYEARLACVLQLRSLEAELTSRLAKPDAAYAAKLRELKADIGMDLSKVERGEEGVGRVDERHVRCGGEGLETRDQGDRLAAP